MTLLDGKGPLWHDPNLGCKSGLWDTAAEQVPQRSWETDAPRCQSYQLPVDPHVQCFNCGRVHGNAAVLDNYRWCMRCRTVLRELTELPEPASLKAEAKPLICILAASWGHVQDPEK